MNILKLNAPEYTEIEGIVVGHKGCSLDSQKKNQHCLGRNPALTECSGDRLTRGEADTAIQSSAHTREGTGCTLSYKTSLTMEKKKKKNIFWWLSTDLFTLSQ